MGRKRMKPKRGLWITDGTDPHPTEHNYHAKVLALMPQLQPGVNSICVAHDTWCGIYQGKRCNCDPDVRLEWRVEPHSQN
jgi:hypothetical protein